MRMLGSNQHRPSARGTAPAPRLPRRQLVLARVPAPAVTTTTMTRRPTMTSARPFPHQRRPRRKRVRAAAVCEAPGWGRALTQCGCIAAALAHEKDFLDKLPSAAMYEKSYMHRDRLSHIAVAPITEFIITARYSTPPMLCPLPLQPW